MHACLGCIRCSLLTAHSLSTRLNSELQAAMHALLACCCLCRCVDNWCVWHSMAACQRADRFSMTNLAARRNLCKTAKAWQMMPPLSVCPDASQVPPLSELGKPSQAGARAGIASQGICLKRLSLQSMCCHCSCCILDMNSWEP